MKCRCLEDEEQEQREIERTNQKIILNIESVVSRTSTLKEIDKI